MERKQAERQHWRAKADRRWLSSGMALAMACCCLVFVGCLRRSILSDRDVLAKVSAAAQSPEVLVLRAGHWEQGKSPGPGTPEGDLHIAETLYRQEQFAEAEQAFEEVAELHADTPEVHERAMFMRAEACFQQGKFARARDCYEELVEKYPGGKYVEPALRRLFAIADVWLDEAREEISRGEANPFPDRFVNFEFGRKPVFDLDGNAVRVLDYIRQQEPNGPLADDSLIMSAGYLFGTGKYEEAELYLDQLIREYPDSEYQPKAHLLSAEAKLLAYQGAPYDAAKLEQSERILQAALRQFPDRLQAERQRIYGKLESMRDERARREYKIGEWYERLGKHTSAVFYYQWVLKHFPDSKWGRKAARRLAEIALRQEAEPGEAEPKAGQEEVGDSARSQPN